MTPRSPFDLVRPRTRPLLAVALPLLIVACGGGGGDGGGIEDGVAAPPDVPLGEPANDAGVSPPADTAGLRAACGAVSVARMSWASADAMAEIDRFILREGYGCDVTLVDGDTLPTFRSMADGGGPDLAPALWIDAIRAPFTEAVAAGDLVLGAETLSDGGSEGWWIPGYFAEAHPDIRTVEDALRRPELFASSPDGGSGVVHNCPDVWSCNVTNENLFRAYGADAMGFVLRDAASGSDLDDSVALAVSRRSGWLGYYWSPTALVGRHAMVRLEGAPHDPDEWRRCTSVPDCPDPAPNGYRTSEVRAVVTPGFVEKAGVAMAYVGRRGWDDGTVSAVLAWMADNEADGEEAARHFLETHENVWTTWVEADTAERIRAAL